MFYLFSDCEICVLLWTALKEHSDGHLGYYTMWDNKFVPKFQRNMLPPSFLGRPHYVHMATKDYHMSTTC